METSQEFGMRPVISATYITLGLAFAAQAEANSPRLRTGYVVSSAPAVSPLLTPADVTYNTIYLNGCFTPDACDFVKVTGQNDSTQNVSSIASGTVSAFSHGPMAWD